MFSAIQSWDVTSASTGRRSLEPKDPRELLGLLANKIQQFFTIGGAPFYTPDDIAYILSHVESPNARLYARVKYAGQTSFAEELARSMRIEVAKLPSLGLWRVPRPEWLLDLSRLAIYEDVNPSVCTICHGVASKLVENKIVECGACNGSGRRVLSGPERAEIMGIDRSNWYRVWSWRYDEIRGETLYTWDSQIFNTLIEHKHAHHATG